MIKGWDLRICNLTYKCKKLKTHVQTVPPMLSKNIKPRPSSHYCCQPPVMWMHACLELNISGLCWQWNSLHVHVHTPWLIVSKCSKFVTCIGNSPLGYGVTWYLNSYEYYQPTWHPFPFHVKCQQKISRPWARWCFRVEPSSSIILCDGESLMCDGDNVERV